MPRPRSDDRRAAIVAAASLVIAVQGLSAATATIAREAGVSNGSLFTCFDTKADLLSQLNVELADMAAAGGPALVGSIADSDADLLRSLSPERRRVLDGLLSVIMADAERRTGTRPVSQVGAEEAESVGQSPRLRSFASSFRRFRAQNHLASYGLPRTTPCSRRPVVSRTAIVGKWPRRLPTSHRLIRPRLRRIQWLSGAAFRPG